ncbi:MAG: SDR family oxidoreductase [Proteobacteria bacterium]|nr:SDR family oxidoreductase [Pseudomonadota bacterium]
MPHDRVVLVTGATGALGGATVEFLLADGWQVASAQRSAGGPLKSSGAVAQPTNDRLYGVSCELADPEAVKRMVQSIVARWGRLDALVHCAGSFQRVPLLEQSAADWLRAFDDNLHGLFHLSRAVAPVMQGQRWGRIITFAAANADQAIGQPLVTAHAIAKLGVLVLTRSLARVLGPDGITANAISPGFIASGGLSADDLAAIAPQIPAGRLGRLEDVTEVVRFLLSEQAAYVNGANLQVSGGWGV